MHDITLFKVLLMSVKCNPGFVGKSRLAEVFQRSLRIVHSGRGTVALADKDVLLKQLLFASLYRAAQSFHAVYVDAEWYGKVDVPSEIHGFSESPRHCVAFRNWLFESFVSVEHGEMSFQLNFLRRSRAEQLSESQNEVASMTISVKLQSVTAENKVLYEDEYLDSLFKVETGTGFVVCNIQSFVEDHQNGLAVVYTIDSFDSVATEQANGLADSDVMRHR